MVCCCASRSASRCARRRTSIGSASRNCEAFLHDYVLLGLVIYSFSLAVMIQARSNSQELHNASLAIVDEDRSEVSHRITHAFLPPLFQPPQMIAERDIVPLINKGTYTFVIDIP